MHSPITFHGKPELKDELVTRAVEHREADRLIQSYGYFEQMDEDQALYYNQEGNNGAKCDWKPGDWAGCAIGCLASPVLSQEEYERLDSYELFKSFESSVRTLEDEFGVPPELVVAAEHLFESLPKEDAVRWPEQLVRAIPVGVTLNWYSFIEDPDNNWYASDGVRVHDRRTRTDSYLLARDQLLGWLYANTPAVVAA